MDRGFRLFYFYEDCFLKANLLCFPPFCSSQKEKNEILYFFLKFGVDRTANLRYNVQASKMRCAQIAQLVEQRTENPRVTGSIPVLGIFLCTTIINPTTTGKRKHVLPFFPNI